METSDREKVIKWLECCGTYDENLEHVGCTEECPYYGNASMCDPIAPFQDALALLKEQEWISVKDRLPNCNGCYLVWRPHFYTDKGMPSICYFDGLNTWHDSYGVDFTRTLAPEDVSHWKSLPEQPYKAVKW